MQRHPQNENLMIHNASGYCGMPIQVDKGPFVQQYLGRLRDTIERAAQQYSRVFAFRIDLRFPTGVDLPESHYTNQVIERFFESFKAKIRHNRRMARMVNKYAHDSSVRYVWAREVGLHGRPHYHVAFLLNFDAFNALGKFETGRDNMFNRLEEAWASALGLPVEGVRGLVEIPPNPTYCLRRDDPQSQAEFFYRASYLCKTATKVYGDGQHGFGASRI
ncbi:inovirus-type Gp2 protein [Pseudomonas otitidis]|uniref:Inovirus-type Gp2 protein n=1 Tax=Metapseudomonas otitidis TaxID=319939 RepID=A0A7X3KT88_9GAMM|nr:inovirus Gp2 family protein [Pseudomonas otitidis]MWK54648.1 inovirus-type Gp2 protein [Pseudomonas otitidis]